MIKCTLFLLLAAVALSNAIPFGVYDDMRVGRWPHYLKSGVYPYIGGRWGDVADIYSTIGDVYRTGVYDKVTPFGGDIIGLLKGKQIEQKLDLDDEHKLQQVQLMQAQRLLHDLQIEQKAQTLAEREVYDRLHLAEQVQMQEQKERLEELQWMHKLELDQLHNIEDVKTTAYGYPGAFWNIMGGHKWGWGPYKTFGYGGYRGGYGYGLPWGIRSTVW